MSLDIFYHDDVQDRLDALHQSNERWLSLALNLGANARDIALVRSVVAGMLDDVATSFGLRRAEPTTLALPVATAYAFREYDGSER